MTSVTKFILKTLNDLVQSNQCWEHMCSLTLL